MLTADEKQALLDGAREGGMSRSNHPLVAIDGLSRLGLITQLRYDGPILVWACSPAGLEAARRLRAEPPPHGAFTVLMRELAETRKPGELPREIVWHVNEADFRPFDHSGEAIPEGWTCWIFENGRWTISGTEVAEAAGRTGEECLRRVVKLVQRGP